MAEVNVVTVKCDAPGCGSYTTLPPGETHTPKYLEDRGWACVPGATPRDYCPAHRPGAN